MGDSVWNQGILEMVFGDISFARFVSPVSQELFNAAGWHYVPTTIGTCETFLSLTSLSAQGQLFR
jgi:hypothetical protein